jgi:hypothetical protein
MAYSCELFELMPPSAASGHTRRAPDGGPLMAKPTMCVRSSPMFDFSVTLPPPPPPDPPPPSPLLWLFPQPANASIPTKVRITRICTAKARSYHVKETLGEIVQVLCVEVLIKPHFSLLILLLRDRFLLAFLLIAVDETDAGAH